MASKGMTVVGIKRILLRRPRWQTSKSYCTRHALDWARGNHATDPPACGRASNADLAGGLADDPRALGVSSPIDATEALERSEQLVLRGRALRDPASLARRLLDVQRACSITRGHPDTGSVMLRGADWRRAITRARGHGAARASANTAQKSRGVTAVVLA